MCVSIFKHSCLVSMTYEKKSQLVNYDVLRIRISVEISVNIRIFDFILMKNSKNDQFIVQ